MLTLDIRPGALESGSVPEAGVWGLVGCRAWVALVQSFLEQV